MLNIERFMSALIALLTICLMGSPALAHGKGLYATESETREGALTYSVGGDPAYSDSGFAIGTPGANRSPWVKCVPEISVIQTFGNTAKSMGWVHFEAADGTKSKVDKSFGYVRDDDGDFRILVYHSSTLFAVS